MPQRKSRRRSSPWRTKVEFLLQRKLEVDPAGLLTLLGAESKPRRRRTRRQ